MSAWLHPDLALPRLCAPSSLDPLCNVGSYPLNLTLPCTDTVMHLLELLVQLLHVYYSWPPNVPYMRMSSTTTYSPFNSWSLALCWIPVSNAFWLFFVLICQITECLTPVSAIFIVFFSALNDVSAASWHPQGEHGVRRLLICGDSLQWESE